MTEVDLVEGFELVFLVDPDPPFVVPTLSCPAEHIALSGGATWDSLNGDATITSELALTDGLPTGVTVTVFPDYTSDPVLDGLLIPWVLCLATPA